jgi:hypothetical protein
MSKKGPFEGIYGAFWIFLFDVKPGLVKKNKFRNLLQQQSAFTENKVGFTEI